MNDELDPYFENQTRASEWRSLRIALMRRLAALETANNDALGGADKMRIEKEIVNLKASIDALLIEEVSQQFAEDAVRVTIAIGHAGVEDGEEA